jgi:hypothetical protein
VEFGGGGIWVLGTRVDDETDAMLLSYIFFAAQDVSDDISVYYSVVSLSNEGGVARHLFWRGVVAGVV